MAAKQKEARFRSAAKDGPPSSIAKEKAQKSFGRSRKVVARQKAKVALNEVEGVDFDQRLQILVWLSSSN